MKFYLEGLYLYLYDIEYIVSKCVSLCKGWSCCDGGRAFALPLPLGGASGRADLCHEAHRTVVRLHRAVGDRGDQLLARHPRQRLLQRAGEAEGVKEECLECGHSVGRLPDGMTDSYVVKGLVGRIEVLAKRILIDILHRGDQADGELDACRLLPGGGDVLVVPNDLGQIAPNRDRWHLLEVFEIGFGFLLDQFV